MTDIEAQHAALDCEDRYFACLKGCTKFIYIWGFGCCIPVLFLLTETLGLVAAQIALACADIPIETLVFGSIAMEVFGISIILLTALGCLRFKKIMQQVYEH